MEVLTTVLPIIIDVLLIALLIVGIILVIKCIYIIDKAKAVVLNIEEKVNSLNSLFTIISMVNDKISGLTEKIIVCVESLILKLFKRSSEEDEEVIEEKKTKKERK